MPCIIAAPSSGSGKTILSLILTAWATSHNKSIQTFKVGPDYLDPQQLSAVAKKTCINLDVLLSGKRWVNETFYKYGKLADYSLIEGVMGLFDGIGSTSEGSTADLAISLDLPIILVVEAKGQAASLAPLVKGFRDECKKLNFAGVVVNKVNTFRHKQLLEEVLRQVGVKMLGAIPHNKELIIPQRHLGLAPVNEMKNLEERLKSWASIAESSLKMKDLEVLLKSSHTLYSTYHIKHANKEKKKILLEPSPIAIAEDNAFHFRYQETKEKLEELNMPTIRWSPMNDEEIPKEAKGLIIPGGFPEIHAEQLSYSLKSLESLRSFFNTHPIYAECGGMLLLGETLTDLEGNSHKMSGILPFKSKKSNLKVGYRRLKSLDNSLILEKNDNLIGHEFHKWEIYPSDSLKLVDSYNYNHLVHELIKHPWEIKGWGVDPLIEGWSNRLLHASWIHLHWPSSPKILELWAKKVNLYKNNTN